jgi:tRNA dimethylallyltransferase
LDIGSAKPSRAERAAVPHHLIDIRDPVQPYSAADFVADAQAVVRDIRHRGHLPLIVGGTMMYARALREGLANLPSADPALRADIEAQAQQLGWPALHERLRSIDPVTAERLAPNDRQRIGRALEIHARTGQPASVLLDVAHPPALAVRTIALRTEERARLHARIEARFDAMLAQGFLDEVRSLKNRPDLHADLPAIRSVGYRQAWDYLEGNTDLTGFRDAALAATRQLAKRQMTWLRAMTDAWVLDPFTSSIEDDLAAAVAALSEGHHPPADERP